MVEVNIGLAIIGIGLTYSLWGLDKLLEVYERGKHSKKLLTYSKTILGSIFLILGVILIVLVII